MIGCTFSIVFIEINALSMLSNYYIIIRSFIRIIKIQLVALRVAMKIYFFFPDNTFR